MDLMVYLHVPAVRAFDDTDEQPKRNGKELDDLFEVVLEYNVILVD